MPFPIIVNRLDADDRQLAHDILELLSKRKKDSEL